MQRIVTLIYSIKQGIKNIKRNRMFSIASIGTITTCLFLFGIFYCLLMNFQHLLLNAEKGVSVTVFFDENITDEEISAIGDKIRVRAEVSSYDYVSAQEAWEEYKATKLNPEQIASFGNDNPLENSAHYIVYLNDIELQDVLVRYLQSIPGVRQVNSSKAIADMFSGVNKGLAYGTGIIIAILLGVAIFLISTTVTMGVSVRRQEISIMKLIGATDFFIRAPFIVEGIIIGLVGAILPLGLLYFVYNKAIAYLMTGFNSPFGQTPLLKAGSVFSALIPISLAIGVGIGFLGSFMTLGKQLRKIN
ncbi:MAG: permease-like cell division protein FtsX [Clostridiales bacterium]|nr:permease-like cell division protein FtsX [Clostridiales bacterium]